ncbi:bublin coiled-coil protein [Alosa pseudoharengus]|uniref:bublin coiled-coil protein n=1 Tax=Alosa pseudoharengus TaxID=34774 RepID=UPI003F8B38C8
MSGPNGDPNITIDDGIIEDDDDFNEEEYAAINTMLDQINYCLDDLEDRNDALNGKLHELLESNRQARQEFRAKINESLAEGQQHPVIEQSSNETPTPPIEEDNE